MMSKLIRASIRDSYNQCTVEFQCNVKYVCVCQDGTIKLWEYESGRKLQSWDLKELEETPNSEADKRKVTILVTTACYTLSARLWHVLMTLVIS